MAIRAFHLSDVFDVNGLHRDVWWPERSAAGWKWLDSNPARRDIEAPLGWVLENDQGRVGAFIGNFVQRFWVDGRLEHGASGFSVIVPSAHRGSAGKLIRTLLGQPNCMVRYTLNANPKSAPIYPHLKMQPSHERGHDFKLAWIVDPLACLSGRLLRMAVNRRPDLSLKLGEQLNCRRTERVDKVLSRALPRGVRRITNLSDISDYAGFWAAYRDQGRMTADRSPEIMRWRMADPDLTAPPFMLGYEIDGRLVGYAQAMLSKGCSIEPPSLEILDLIALDGAEEALPALTQAILDLAPRLGAARVRLQVVNGFVLDALGGLARRARREGGWGHCHALFDADVDPAALDWRPAPFDGDYAICLRPTPQGRVKRPNVHKAPQPDPQFA
ncbi:N-acetyltransferase [Brevundimonas faecalis]|uniref:N-acetyltransferase n=1 Tax=Brevundimonas faecalis TaxID=947378 RepID=A0ABV2RFV1_9CAUL